MKIMLLILSQEVGMDQRLNEPVPPALEFFDEAGRRVRMGDFFGERPIVLALVYLQCPMLCKQVLQGLRRSLRSISLTQGVDYHVIAASFNPEETPAMAAKQRAEYGWTFLTGKDESIRRLAETVGFRYRYDSESGQFAHAAGIIVLTPEGKVARYLFGIEYPARDLRLALVEASEGKIGTAADQFLLLCYAYDPKSGRYTVAILGWLRVAGIATVIVLAAFILRLARRERRRVDRAA